MLARLVALMLLGATQVQGQALRCEAEGIIGYPPEPKAQCLRTLVLMMSQEEDGCTADLGEMARESARIYAVIRKDGEQYTGLFDGLAPKRPGHAGRGTLCVTTCIKLPTGSALVELRGVVGEGRTNAHPGRKTYSAGMFDAELGKPYIMHQETTETAIGPVVCARVGNALPDENKWWFGLYAYYRTSR